ncbi:MAG: hypothetical protein JXA54_12600 [Candidatus Heimdallarchaeota archaeon]|nr:hypothetical protein [Candidatus Heimdallarchaeota archaeon]
MIREVAKLEYFKKWTWKTVLYAFICFLLLSGVNGLFTLIIDVELLENTMGYAYIYFTIIFFTTVLYFFYAKLKVNWLGTFSFGLMGLIGIVIELWLEYYLNPVLRGIWAGFAWGGVYILYGLVADLSMLLIKKMKNELNALIVSSLFFSLGIILISIIPLKLFYLPTPPGTRGFLTYWYYFIPYSLIQGMMGAILGYFLSTLNWRKNKENS